MTIDGLRPEDQIASELTDFVRETAPELLAPAAPRTKRRGIMALAAVAAGAIALLASIHAFAGQDAATATNVRVQHACAVVLGLDPSEAPYQDCAATLARVAPGADPPMPIVRQKARSACADIGLDPGSIAFGQCVADVEQSLSAQPALYR